MVPEGTKVTGSLALKVTDLESSNSNIVPGEGEALQSVDVHVDGVAADNTVPVTVTINDYFCCAPTTITVLVVPQPEEDSGFTKWDGGDIGIEF